MATGSVQSKSLTIQLTLKELEEAKGDIGRLKFVKDAQGRTVVKATPKWSLRQYLINTLFHRKACHLLVKQAHDFLSLSNQDTRLRERVVRLLDNDGFPQMSRSEKKSLETLIEQPRSRPQPSEFNFKVGVEETAFDEPPVEPNINFFVLQDAMPEKTDENAQLFKRFNTYEKAMQNFQECQEILQNQHLTPKEMQEQLSEKCGLFFHMTRKDKPTTPDAALRALKSVAYMMKSLALPENAEKRQEALVAILSSDMPCQEAQITHAQKLFAKIIEGIEIPDEEGQYQKSDLDKNLPIKDNFMKLLYTFLDEFPEEDQQTCDNFVKWTTEKDGVVGFSAQDGDITLDVVTKEAEYIRDELFMLV